MDDLIPFLVFIVIALINLGKFLLEKKFQGKKPPLQDDSADEKPASPFEEFFDNLARKLDPNEKPETTPDWPKGYEKPDYAAEQAAYQEFQGVEAEEDVEYESAPVAEIIPMREPVMALKRTDVALEAVDTTALKSAMNAIPALKSNFGPSVQSAPILRSGHAGAIHFSLKDKAHLRKAILAKVVLDPPRAFDKAFENTSAH